MKLSNAALTALLASASASGPSFDPRNYNASDVVQRDFAIVGGGASGTYAAIALKDLDKTLAVVEKSDRLGGHTHTYRDPESGGHVDYGVQVYLNSSVVRDFFTRLNASFSALDPAELGNPLIYADFASRQLLSNYSAGEIGQDYIDALDSYAPGSDDFTYLSKSPSPDLTLKWTDYIKKFNISKSSAYATFNRPAIPGDLLSDLTLYVFNDDNDAMLQEAMAGGALLNANRDNSQMYRNAKVELGDNVLYESTVIAASRNETSVSLVVQTATGTKLVLAKQLIIAMPQVSDNMKPFDLDIKEAKLINNITGGYYYGGVVNNTGLNQTAAYYNRGINTTYNVAAIPGVDSIRPSPVDGFHYYWYNSDRAVNKTQVEASVLEAIETLQTLEQLPGTQPNFVAYSDFTPLQLRVPASDIQQGFYEKFKELQGYRGTWYVGAFFVVGSSQVFNDTKNLLPAIVAAAGG